MIPTSIFIEARSWFDKSGGNSYWSARVCVDGDIKCVIPMTYGYGAEFIRGSLEELQKQGVIVSSDAFDLKTAGVHIYSVIYPSKKKEMFK